MIQDFTLNIKSIFNSKDIKFYCEPVFDQIQSLENYCLNHLSSSSLHTHYGDICQSPNLSYYQSYERHYVSFHGTIDDQMLKVPVLYCQNDKHYHSILPSSFIIPHSSFSLCFVLQTLSLKIFSSLTVEKIVERFQISISTLYRWLDKYSHYLRIFVFLRNKYHMHFFLHLIYDYDEVISDIFDITLHTLFQNDRTLLKPLT